MGLSSILLVDDDNTANYLHEHLIKKVDIAREVFTKANGMEALLFIEKRYRTLRSLPSLILLDINMPVLNGLEFIKDLLDSELLAVKNIPVAILSSSSHTADISKVKELGNYMFISKPLTEEKLLGVIGKTLNEPETEQSI
jgi:CheY-like chemotaxis protein